MRRGRARQRVWMAAGLALALGRPAFAQSIPDPLPTGAGRAPVDSGGPALPAAARGALAAEIPLPTPPSATTAEVGYEAGRPLPINLATALKLANVRTLDIAAAEASIRQSLGLLTQARALLIPNLNGGVGYYRHDGLNQNLFTGQVFQKGTNALLVGGGPTLQIGLTDGIFAPLAAKRVVRSRQADLQSARNNSLFDVARAYFALQNARGRLGGSEIARDKAEELVRLTRGLSAGLVAPLEVNRALAQLETLKQDIENSRRDWRIASAQLAQTLLLDMGGLLEPIEPPFLEVKLIPSEATLDGLIDVALSTRPELASQRNLVLVAEAELRRERYRPLLPTFVVTTPQTAGAGVISAGQFYGNVHGQPFGEGGGRSDFATAATWQLQNGGLGYAGVVKQRKATRDLTVVELTRTAFQVKSDVAQALARLQTARARLPEAEEGLKQANESAEKNFIGLRQTSRPAGELLQLVVRPQEVVAAIIQLNTSYGLYFGAVNDVNTAQFELYRALGQPAQWVAANPPGGSEAMPNAAPVPPTPPQAGVPLIPPSTIRRGR